MKNMNKKRMNHEKNAVFFIRVISFFIYFLNKIRVLQFVKKFVSIRG